MDSASNRRVGKETRLGNPHVFLTWGQVVWAAFSLVTFFVAVDKESDSPVGATKSDRIGFERVFFTRPEG